MTVFNMPIYSLDDLDIGQARVFLGTAGTTPLFELGALADVSIETNISEAVIKQGSPRLHINSAITDEDIIVNVTAYEHNLINMEIAYPNYDVIGALTSPGNPNILGFGGKRSRENYSMMVEHVSPVNGCTMQWKFWKVEPVDAPTWEYTPDAYHVLTLKMRCIASKTTWSGADALSGGNVGMYAWFERYDPANYTTPSLSSP